MSKTKRNTRESDSAPAEEAREQPTMAAAPEPETPPPGPALPDAAVNDAEVKLALGRITIEGDPARLEAIGGPAVVASIWDGKLLGCTVVDGVARVEIAPHDG